MHTKPQRVTTKGKERGAVPELLTIAEAAQRLRVHRDTVDRERLAGRLGFVSVRGRVFITADQLSDYINNQRRET